MEDGNAVEENKSSNSGNSGNDKPLLSPPSSAKCVARGMKDSLDDKDADKDEFFSARWSLDVADGNDAENDWGSNGGSLEDDAPLLSSPSADRVKMGPFSIRYDNPASRRVRPSRLYGPLHDEDEEDEDEFFRRHGHSSTAPSVFLRLRSNCRRACFLPPRILLLALHLACTLSSFWILDSVKEPTLAILVGGDLGRHQPRAKMLSFVAVLGMAVGMELARRRGVLRGQGQTRRDLDDADANAEIVRSWEERNLSEAARERNGNGKVRWKTMAVGTSRFWKRFRGGSNEEANHASSSRITPVAFYVVGSFYIHSFVVVAVALREHPSFRATSAALETLNDGDGAPARGRSFLVLGYVFFALVESFGSVALVVFWSFANSHLTLAAAERHYGHIVAIAQAGAIGGSTLAAVLGRRRRDDPTEGGAAARDDDGAGDAAGAATPALILWACGGIGVGMACMALYSRLFSGPMEAEEGGAARDRGEGRRDHDADLPLPLSETELRRETASESSGQDGSADLLGGLRLIFRHKYLKLILAVSVLYEISLTCLHYEMNLIGLHRFGGSLGISDDSDISNERHVYDLTDPSNNEDTPQKEGFDQGVTFIQFLGWYGQTVNVLSLFLSFYVFPRLMKQYGLRFTIRIFPTVLLVVTVSAFIIFPRNLSFLFVSLGICKALTYSVHDPAQEVLYMPTSDDAKFRAKFWIDVVGQRIVKAAGAAINNYAGSVEGIVKYGSVPSVVASLVLWLACYQVGIMFEQLSGSGSKVGLDDDESLDTHGMELCEDRATEDDISNSNREDKKTEREPVDCIQAGQDG